MNIRLVCNYIGKMMALDSVCMIPALFIAIFMGERQALYAFLVTIILQAAFGLLILLTVKPKDKRMYAKEGFVIVVLCWVMISFFGAIPVCLSGAIPSFVDALFEIVSGFTTTGATILAEIEGLPMSILYWRSFTHWLGGMGVLVLVLALAPSDRESGMTLHILRAESPGPTVGKFAPKLHLTARILYLIYIALTVLELILLLCGGMPFFDALTTAFGTAGTGGFAIKNDSIASYSMYCQGVVSVFMLLFGVNFSVYFLALVGNVRDIWKNSELRLYLGIIAVSTVAIAINVVGNFSNFGGALHHSFFQVTSIMTTTGFSTVDFNAWPDFSQSIIIILTVIGACAGSTGGGFKVSRLIIIFKSLKVEKKKLIHPRSVTVPTIDGKALEKNTSDRCAAFLYVYVATVIVSVLLLSVENNGFKTNFTAVLACLNNVGPGLGDVGPLGNFSFFSPLSKIVLMLDMLLGRLELFPMLLIFMPSTWRRKRF